MSFEKCRQKGDMLLEIRGLKIDGNSAGSWHPIVQGVDLTLRRGEILGLIGESGAGKSTLGLSAMGYVRPGCRIAGGKVTFDGRDLLAMSEVERRKLWGSRIAYVAQSAAAAFNPAHRLIEQAVETAVREGVMARQAAIADAKNLFQSLRLPNPDKIGERYPHQVSGGQLQRIMTAMAMSCRPDLIIFDEPTTALDVTTQVGVLAAMRDIVQRFDTAAIYITHDLAVVAQMADRIMVLRHGLEVEEASTAKMLSAPEADYTKTLWAVRSLQKTERKSDDMVLEVRNIDAYYGELKVLKNVSVTLPRGSTVSIVGESGSGKSTLARVITGLLPARRGDILFNGKGLPSALDRRDRETLRRIQYIYQSADTSLNPRHSLRELIGRPLTFYRAITGKERDAMVIELLEAIELGANFIDRLPGELSGGQRQRISIAKALAADPEVIICDEITSALDQVVQEGILKLLMRLQKERDLSYLFITHDIATVNAISDEVVVMNNGEVVEHGLKSAVMNSPHSEYTKMLLSSVPKLDPNWLTELLGSRPGDHYQPLVTL